MAGEGFRLRETSGNIGNQGGKRSGVPLFLSLGKPVTIAYLNILSLMMAGGQLEAFFVRHRRGSMPLLNSIPELCK
jgi:hypothetical protein